MGAPGMPGAGGATVYAASCASCHSGTGTTRAPGYFSLAGMSPRAIVAALEEGKMRVHGETISAEERRAVAEWLTGRAITETPVPSTAYCEAAPPPATEDDAPDWSGWGGGLKGTGFRTAEQAGLSPEDVSRLTLKWAFGFPDAIQSRSQPAVVGRRLIVGSQFGEVFALDVDAGCVRWVFSADAGVRGAISVGDGPQGQQAAFFVDFRTNVYAVDAQNGALLWKTRAGQHHEASNTGSPAYYDGRLFVPVSSMEVVTAQDPAYECCTSSGAVVALDAKNGAELWRHRVIAEEAHEVGLNAKGTRIFAPSGAPVWSSPTVDARRGLLYLGTGENYTRPASETSDAVLALDLETGALAWLFQATAKDAYNLACVVPVNRENCPDPMGPDVDFGMAPILARRADGSEILVVGQKSGVVYGFDPDQNGVVLWETRIGKGGALGGIHWGMATDGRLAYATNSDHPFGFLGVEPEIPPAPGVYALDLTTGEVVWSQPAPADVCGDRPGCFAANSAAPTAIPGVVFAGSLDGHLRAYAAEDGTVLWDFDTARAFSTVNGIEARGGAIDGPGPVVAHGMVFVNSGYGLFNQMPGNVLLAFGVEGN